MEQPAHRAHQLRSSVLSRHFCRLLYRKAAPNAEAAKEFLAYLQTDKAMTVFEGVGFSAV